MRTTVPAIRSLLALLFLFLAFAATTGCGKKTVSPKPLEQESGAQPNHPNHNNPSNMASHPQKSTTLKVNVGQSIQIQFEDEPTPDYNWYYEVSQDWVISMTEPYAYPSKSAPQTGSNPNADDKKTKTFDVKGLKKGTVNIRFYKIHPWEQNKKALEERFYTIEVVE